MCNERSALCFIQSLWRFRLPPVMAGRPAAGMSARAAEEGSAGVYPLGYLDDQPDHPEVGWLFVEAASLGEADEPLHQDATLPGAPAQWHGAAGS
jgi:hypothetical protein